MRRFAFGSFALVLATVSGCRGGAAAEKDKAEAAEPVAVQIAAAAVKPVDMVVAAQGTLAARQGASVKVAPVAAGRLTEVRVKEGDRVTAGQVIAVVDMRIQRAQQQSASAALSTAEAQAQQAALAANASSSDVRSMINVTQLGLQSAILDRDNGVRSAETALRAAETDLTKTRAGARPQEIAQADQQVTQAKATRDRAAAELERVQFLVEKGISAKRNLEDAKTALAVANSALSGAQAQASLVRAGARTEDLRSAEIRVQQAQESLAQAKSSGDARVAQARALLRQAEQGELQAGVKAQEARAARQAALQKRADLSAAQSTLSFAELRSPIAGVVARRAQNPGDMADPAVAVVEISNVQALDVVASMPAEDGFKVRAGMPARIRPSDAPTLVVSGVVISVGQVDPLTNLLSVRIAVAGAKGAIPAGSFVAAEIIVRSIPNAVVVPRIAIITRDGESVVFVVSADGVAHQKKVTVGVEDRDVIQIVEGVKAGEQVVTVGGHELQDGAKVKPEAPEGAKTEKAGEGSAKR